jgi:hypothetical protein
MNVCEALLLYVLALNKLTNSANQQSKNPYDTQDYQGEFWQASKYAKAWSARSIKRLTSQPFFPHFINFLIASCLVKELIHDLFSLL